MKHTINLEKTMDLEQTINHALDGLFSLYMFGIPIFPVLVVTTILLGAICLMMRM